MNIEKLKNSLESYGEKYNLTFVKKKLTVFKFKCHITSKNVVTNRIKNHLKSLNMTHRQYILDLNGISEQDLPVCKYCNTERVRIFKKLDKPSLLDPVIGKSCHKKQCGIDERIKIRTTEYQTNISLYFLSFCILFIFIDNNKPFNRKLYTCFYTLKKNNLP